MLDFHLHVWDHSPGTPPPTFELLEQYCERAASRGIERIAITEHCYRFTRIADEVLLHWERPRVGPTAEATDHVLQVEGGADLDAYVDALQQAQDRGLPLLIGLEVDHLAGTTEAMRTLLDDYPFDVLLGSVHWLDDWLFDDYGNKAFAQVWRERPIDDVFRQYCDALVKLAHSGLVDVLAHIDVIKVAGYTTPNLSTHEARLVDGLTGADIAIEFSSAGLHKPVASTYPSSDLLDRLVTAGFPLTTAADGHSIDEIGRGFDRLTSELQRRQITELATFSRRNRSMIPLPLPPIDHPPRSRNRRTAKSGRSK